MCPGVISGTSLSGSVGLSKGWGLGMAKVPAPTPAALRCHHLSKARFVPKTSPSVLPEPRDKGLGRAGHPWGSRGHGVGAATRRRYSVLLTPPERFPQISQTCWNCHSSRFWRCRRIPARGSPPGSVMVMGRAGGVSLGTRHTTGHPQGEDIPTVTLTPSLPPPAPWVPKFEACTTARLNEDVGEHKDSIHEHALISCCPSRIPPAAGVPWPRCHHDSPSP